MLRPPNRKSKTAALKRDPPHSSQRLETVSMNPSSVKTKPAPLQVSQAPSELALNNAGFTPWALAKTLRIGSSSPVYVPGLLRRDPMIEDWSIDTTSGRSSSSPWISELLPEPATPVTATNTPFGMSTSISRRLLVLAPLIAKTPSDGRTCAFSDARWAR